ncbi:MAG: 3-methyl-2-oxobutanoate hydroxymethyltransferase [Polyangiaceae bacterium]
MYGPTHLPKGEKLRKVTVPEIRDRKSNGPSIAMVTAYDFTMARLLDEAGVDVVLVGDSLGMIFQGLPNTLPVTVDEICYHGRAVARGLGRAHLVGDMPFMSFHVSAAQAVENAGKMMKEGAFESVKIEGGIEVADRVAAMVSFGIPVMGHVGLVPQRVHAFGGFRVQGKTDEAADRIIADAIALEQAGVYAIVLEAMPAEVASRVTRAVSVPTIGIGAGRGCDGQVLVCTDLVGMSRGHSPKFVKQFAQVGDAVVDATRAYIDEVRAGTFPGKEHEYQAAPAPNAVLRTAGE